MSSGCTLTLQPDYTSKTKFSFETLLKCLACANSVTDCMLAFNSCSEKVVIPYNKPFISLQGAGETATTISYSDTASKSGTADSATFTVWAPNFVASGIGFVVRYVRIV